MSEATREKPPTGRRGPGRIAILGAWVGGGMIVVVVLALAGLLGGGEGTTTVKEVASRTGTTALAATSSGSSTGSEAAVDTEALYAEASRGVVEIRSTVRGAGGESTATGAGFIVDGEGTVVTAAHVVDEATAVEVTLADGTTRSAEVLGEDQASDLAVIRFDAAGLRLHPLEIADSSALHVGAWVAAIGSPFEYAGSLSTGIVSGLERTIEAPNGFTVSHAIQTDAAVNPGNSGGPLLDSEGKVIGVVDQIATDGSADQSSGVGFAVPSDLVSAELEALEGGEAVEHAYLGVATTTVTEPSAGAEVAEVVAGSPAAAAGLRQGDVITGIDGTAVAGTEELAAAIGEHRAHEKVTLAVERGSESLALELRLGTQPAASGAG